MAQQNKTTAQNIYKPVEYGDEVEAYLKYQRKEYILNQEEDHKY